MDLAIYTRIAIVIMAAMAFGWWMRGRDRETQCVTIMVDGVAVEVTADVIGRAGVMAFLASCGITAFNEDGSPTPNRLLLLRLARDLGHQGPPGFSWEKAFEVHEGDDLFPQVVTMTSQFKPRRFRQVAVPEAAPRPPEDAL